MPGFELFPVVTYTPFIFTGVGMTCKMVDNESWGEQALQNGKTVLKALAIIDGLETIL